MIVKIRDMGANGINSDLAPWDLPPNMLTDGRNFRVMSGKVQSSGGSQLLLEGARGTIGHLDQSSDFEGTNQWILCHSNGVDTLYNQEFVGIYDANGTVDPYQWTTCQIGQVTFLNHPSTGPIYFTDWSSIAEGAEPLQWSPTQDKWEHSARQLHAHKNFLFALGMVEDGEYYEDRVRWSHPCDPNGIPYTWEGPDKDPSSLAGFVTLGRGGMVVGAESLRDSFVIYSQEALNVLDFTGDALVWRRRTLSQTAGLVGEKGLIEVGGIHFFISSEDIMMFDGNSAQSLLHNRLRKRFATTLNEDARHRAFAVDNKMTSEAWFCVAEVGHDEPNVAYVYNYRDGSWAIRDLSTTRNFSHATFGYQPVDVLTWEDFAQPWLGERTTWATANRQPFDGVIIGCSGNQVHNVDTQYPDDPGLTTFIERVSMPMQGHEDVTMLSRIYPQVEGNTPVEVSVGSHHYAGDGARWKPPVVFDPKTDRKVDIRTSGELHAFRVEGPTNGNFNLTGLDIEFVPAGGR